MIIMGDMFKNGNLLTTNISIWLAGLDIHKREERYEHS